MKHLRLYWLICSIALGVFAGGCGKPQPLREAGQLAKQGQEAEKTDFAAAVQFYQAALKKVEDFSAQSAASSQPDQRVRDETRIGPYTLAELRDRVLPQVQQKNAAQEDPLACAFVLAFSTKNSTKRSALFTEVAKSYAALGQDDQVQKVVGAALGDFVWANAVLDRAAQEEPGGMWKAMDAPDEEALKIANSTKAAVLSFLDNVIGQYFTLGRAGRAWALLQLMSGQEQEELRDAGWNTVAFHHVDLGQLEEALGASTFIVDPAIRAGALIKIANQYTEAGQAALAVDWGDWNTVGQWPPVPRSLRQAFLAPYEDAEQLALHIMWSLIAQWTDPAIPGRIVFPPYRKDRAAGILVQAQRIAEAIGEFPDRVTQLTGVVQGYVAAEHYNRALALIDKFRDPEPKAILLTTVATQYANTGHAELARPLLDQVMQMAKAFIDPSVRTEVMKNAARIYITTGKEEAALQIAHAFKDSFARAEVLQTLVRKEAACDHIEEAVLLARTIAADEARADALTAIAKAYVVSGQLKRATDLIAEVDQDLPAVARHYIENGQMRQAEQVTEEVSDAAKRAEVLTEVAQGLFTIGDEARGGSVLKRAFLAAEAVQDEQERDKVRTTMARTLGTGQQQEKARRVAETIADPVAQATELAEIARSSFAIGDTSQGFAFLAQALRVGREIHDPAKRARTITNIGKRMMTAGYLPQAYDVALQLENVALRSEMLADVARASLKSEQYERAAHVATTIPDPFIKSRTFAAIAYKAITDGRYDDARQYATAISTVSEKEEVLVGLAHRYATLGRQDEALALVPLIKSAYLKTRVLTDVALAYVADAQEDRLEIFLSGIEDAFPRAQVTAEVARQYALSGQRQKALLLADAIVDSGLRRRTLKTIAERGGGEGENVAFVNMLLQEGKERALREMARAGKCEQAQQMTSGITDSKGRVRALLDIARLCCENGQREQCKGVIVQAVQETRGLSDGQDRSELLSRIVRQLVAIGEREQAVESAKQIEEKAAQAEALIDIARSYLEENQEDRADALIQTIGENRSAKLFTILARKRLETKQWDAAVETARRITDPYERVKALLNIISTCMDNSRNDKAEELLPLVLQDAASVEGVRTNAEVLARVARFYLSLGRVESTLQVAQTIKESVVRAAVLAEVAKEESGSGRLASAAQLAADITNLDLQTEAITAVIYEYLARKDSESAFALAILVKDQNARKDLVTAVAREELSCSDSDSQAVREIGAQGSWKRSREECLSTEPATLIRAYITAGLYDHASQLIELTEDPGEKILLLVELARGYARSGEKEKVEALLERVLRESGSLPNVATKETALASVGMLALQTGLTMNEEMKKALLQIVGQGEEGKGGTVQGPVVGQTDKRK